MNVSEPRVAILMGSKSDLPKIEPTIKTLNEFDVEISVRVMSAHRTPKIVSEFSQTAEEKGFKVIIAAAGGAAHLAGVIAAHTNLPVIGIPVQGGAFQGMDALLATVQMPGGVPVVSVAVGSSGCKNAALFAIRILALNNDGLRNRLKDFQKRQERDVIAADRELGDTLALP